MKKQQQSTGIQEVNEEQGSAGRRHWLDKQQELDNFTVEERGRELEA